MNLRHSSSLPCGHRRGFSLIEVLIAVVVLATGLLALTALQSSLMRESADAKARAQVAAFAQGLVERARSTNFTTLAGPLSTAAERSQLEGVAGIAAGSLNETTTVVHVVGSGGAFLRPGDAGYAAALADAASSPNSPQYKELNVRLSWNDAAGGTRDMRLSGIVSPISSKFSDPLVTRPPDGNTNFAPIVRRPTPEGAGMIPIALGDGSETAATNPRPELIGKKSGTLVADTRFEVLTYSEYTEVGQTFARIQKRVENATIGCSCQNNTNGYPNDVVGAFQKTFAYRPTFWDGLKYGVPKIASYNVSSGPASNAPTQSELCDVCCRDHQDPSGVSGPKFDPFRATHEHFKAVSPTPQVAGINEQYGEACRLVRVDGVWRVAPDFRTEHFGLIATANTATSPLPSPASITNYETFVLGYIGQRFYSGNNDTSVDPVPIAASNGLDDPASITLNASDKRFMHSRGLMVDFIETEALDRITKAKTDCNRLTQQVLCVLPHIPLTAINVTELAHWTKSAQAGSDAAGAWINVTNQNNVVFGDATDPVRGVVTTGAALGTGNSYARSTMGRSNSALALYAAVDPADLSETFNDSQAFEPVGGGGGGGGVPFTVTISNLAATSDATLGNNPSVETSAPSCSSNATQAAPNPNPYECSVATEGGSTTLSVAGYNFIDPAGGPTVQNPCQTNKTVVQPVCKIHTVAGVTLNGSGVGTGTESPQGKINSQTSVALSGISSGSSVVVTFSAPTSSGPTGHTCSGPGNKTLTWILPCQ